MKSILFATLTLLTVTAVGQNKIRKIIPFKSGQFSLSQANKVQIDSIINQIKNKDFQIVLSGHADTTGSEKANYRISKRRTINVLNYFIAKGIDKSKVQTIFFGEHNPIFSNFPVEERIKNRCVEIVIKIEKDNKQIAVSNGTDKTISKKIKFENDTILYFQYGTQIEISAETFYPKKIKDINFDVTEIYNTCDMLANNTMTRAVNGDCLTSAGMLLIKPTIAGIEVQPNKGTLVKIKIPTMGGTIDKAMKLYGGVKNDKGQLVWKDLAPEVSYEESGNQFYVFKVDTLSTFNLDKPMGIICKKDGHKIKTPKQLKNVLICQTYPNEKYLSVAEKVTEKKFILDKVIKEKKPIITILGYDKFDNRT